jgi:hypothetical protein
MLIDKPTVYFRATRDAAYNYSIYCWFHWRDWSELPVPIKALDEHRYDFEGALFVWPRPNSKASPWGCSIYHHEIRFVPLVIPRNEVELEAGGHGALIACTDKLTGNVMQYRDYDLLNLDDTALLHWLKTTVQPAFNAHGVHLPWQWRDSRIGDASTGLIYSDPAKLYELAKRRNLI